MMLLAGSPEEASTKPVRENRHNEYGVICEPQFGAICYVVLEH